MIHDISGPLISLHRRWGDARLLRWLGRFSVGQAREALEEMQIEDTGAESSKSARLASALRGRGVIVITVLDQEYPASFRALDADAPPLLYVIGNLDRLKARSVAIIGTRRPCAHGRAAARKVADGVALAGWTVVSGNAPGVDSTAHAAAVAADGGQTLIFPPAALDSYVASFCGGTPEQITVASPFVPGSPVAPWMFLRRNTLVAAHCCAAFVAETGTRGGTVDTVKKLRKLQRSTFATALPGDAKFAKAHTMLAAGGVTLLDVSEASTKSWLNNITTAAEQRWRHPLQGTLVLDDFFSEAILK